MPAFDTSRRVRHSASDMFDLVSDVESYPQFLPLCLSLRVLRRTVENETQVFVAEMQVGYKAIRETFKTRVSCDRARMNILVEYIDGPFRYLKNSWGFRDAPDQASNPCSSFVDFHIDYEFKSRMLGILMGGMFDQAFRRFADAFERRADEVYGRPRVSARRLA